MVEDIVQTPAVEPPPQEELPAELPSSELPEGVTLPEPPVEVEASGSGPVEDVLQPTTPTAAEVFVEETASEDGLITGEVDINVDVISEAETEEVEVAAVGEEPTTATQDEEHLNEAEAPEEIEISTVASKAPEEEGLPALVPPPEAVDVANEASEPDLETGLLPVDGNSAEGNEEESNPTDEAPVVEMNNAEQPAEGADVNVVLTHPEEPVLEEGSLEKAAETEGQELKIEAVHETPAVEGGASDAPLISTEDLTEDEILLVNRDEPEQPAPDILSPEPPTALSPERESPFTRIADVNLGTEGQPHVVIPSLVEVTQRDVNLIQLCGTASERFKLGNSLMSFAKDNETLSTVYLHMKPDS